MDVVFTHCAGLDVHKKTVMACRVTPDPTGQQADGITEVKEFGTLTRDLLALSDWSAAVGITHVAMESTGEYWRPVYNLLEGRVTIFLVNAAHVKQVPVRKTDKADARWLAKLMRYGLLALQLAHIDFLDEQIDTLSMEITRGLGEVPAEAPPSPNLAGTTGDVASAGGRDAPGPSMPFTQAIALLDTIPGVNQRGAELLVAEWGTDMSRFGTTSRLLAWIGVAPGNDASAGKQRSGKTRKGNHTLRTGLTQIAHAAARTKGTYLSALYQRLAARRGKKRAIIAVAHAIVVSAFHMLSRHEPYRELGPNYFDERWQEHLVDRLSRRIQLLGYRVHFEPVQTA